MVLPCKTTSSVEVFFFKISKCYTLNLKESRVPVKTKELNLISVLMFTQIGPSNKEDCVSSLENSCLTELLTVAHSCIDALYLHSPAICKHTHMDTFMWWQVTPTTLSMSFYCSAFDGTLDHDGGSWCCCRFSSIRSACARFSFLRRSRLSPAKRLSTSKGCLFSGSHALNPVTSASPVDRGAF